MNATAQINRRKPRPIKRCRPSESAAGDAPLGRKRLPNTIDTKMMAELFRHPKINHEKIGLIIHEIVSGAALAIWFHTADERSDAIGDAFEFCLSKLKKFSLKKSDNPAGYFDRMAWRKLCEISGRLQRRRSREVSLDDLESPLLAAEGHS